MATRESEWLMHLFPAEIKELEAAAEPLVAVESNIGAMKQSDFGLPTLGLKPAIPASRGRNEKFS
jgi:hypothetical protein